MRIVYCLILLFVLEACSQVAFTGRRQAQLIPIDTINSLSFSQYDEFLAANNTLPPDAPESVLIRRIGQDLVYAVEVYYKANGMEGELEKFDWEFNVVESEQINAFCMPGGKVVMFTGIMELAQNEDAMAVIMGHEIAHALAHHGNERMSQMMWAQLGMSALDIAISERPQATRELIMTAAGAGAQIGVMLPFSRKHESEADEIGLYLMTMAGYDPTEAVPFWERMGQVGGGAPPEFLSTHPGPERRADNLKRLIPKAREYAEKYPVPQSSRNSG
ncbi:MAG: M48 family peptidase [Saprospirales bacterium]|nr:MAG: M48 family peptidase [Saprospirales bacterium]